MHHERLLPALAISVEGRDYKVQPYDGAVTIGRELPSQIRVNDPRISRTHIRIEPAGDCWRLTDVESRNGTFVDGHRVASIPVDQALIVHLGNANGVAVRLNTFPDETDDGLRTAVGHLGQDDDAETATEEESDDIEAEDESTEALGTTVRVTVMVDAAVIGLRRIKRRIATLPALSDPEFQSQTNQHLADLRRIEATIINDARNASGRPEVALILRDVRNTYADLILEAARAPGATLGQRLYAARNAARLTVQEIATAAAVSVDDVTHAEAERPVSPPAQAALQEIVDALTRRSSST